MNKSPIFALLFSLTTACGGSVDVDRHEPPPPTDDAGASETSTDVDASPAPERDAAPDTARDAAPTPDAGDDDAPDTQVACASCCRVPAGMITCPPDFGCGSCCDTLADGGANPLCPQ